METRIGQASRVFVTSAAMAVVVLGALSSNCDTISDIQDGACETDLRAKVDSLNAASLAFVDAAEELKLEVANACVAIANDLGAEGVPTVSAEMSDDEVQTACELAQGALQAQLDAGVSVEVVVEGGRCEIAAEAQFSCEAECSVDAECDPGSVEVRCDPGELSVQCEGSCEASAVCQGSAEIAANCSGSCSGGCTGTCDGDAVEGATCAGTCEGSCTGECTIEVEGGIDCGAEVRCRGGCEGTATAPSCEAELEPPSCEIDADCQAGCDGQASFEAECTPPTVAVAVTGEAHANLESTLTTNLPALINGFRLKGRLLTDAAVDVVDSASNVAGELGAAATCAAAVGVEVAGNLTAVAEASASVSVSFSASASVSAAAGVN